MAMHKLRIVQVGRVEREIVIEVEAESVEDAVEKQQESDAPPLDDPRWKLTVNELMNEEVTPA